MLPLGADHMPMPLGDCWRAQDSYDAPHTSGHLVDRLHLVKRGSVATGRLRMLRAP